MRYSISVGIVILASLSAGPIECRAAMAAAPSTNALPKPSLPQIKAIKIEPASLKLTGATDVRKVLVLGETRDGQKIDLTGEASFKPESGAVGVDEDGYIFPKEKGQTRVNVTAANLQEKVAVTGEVAAEKPIHFVRDIAPVLSKIGCNAGTCHGSAKGKNGFKLSLRGYDPDFDYQALVNDLSGRRFDRLRVEESLNFVNPDG